MASHKTTKIFIIGGTGAQGIPIVRALVADHAYSVRILTRDLTSRRALDLLALGNVELMEGTFANQETLRQGYSGCDGAFINIDGFNSGEKTEIYWGIRAYELAVEAGIKFYVWGNLDFGYKKGGYNPIFRTGHYDGKGRVGEWVLQQGKGMGSGMGVALFTTGPYIDMAVSASTIMTPTIENGVVTWRVPLGDGAVPHVALSDCGVYARWLFDNSERSNGMDLEVAAAHVPYAELARAFTAVTGKPAQYIDTSLDEYWEKGVFAKAAASPAGYNSDLKDPAAMTIRQNFTGFWNMWKHSGGNKGVVQRDYALLDEILPGRIKSAEEWFRKEEERDGKGSLWERVQPENLKPILKIAEDKRRGRL